MSCSLSDPLSIVSLALAEDIGSGDATTRFFTDPERRAEATIVARHDLILAGTAPAEAAFLRTDPDLKVEIAARDGSKLAPGEAALRISGRAASILTAERVALNFLQRLSGVATLTKRYVDAVAGTGARILDTRKTTPGFRFLEKAAVAAGGACNHRIGLYDMVMVKDNHIAAGAKPSDLQPNIAAAKAAGLRVEIEVDTLEQLREVLALDGVDVVLLDNMPPETLRRAVALRKSGVAFEASGGITLENIRAVAETGVDFISVGALTHSAPAADLSLEM